MLFRSDTMITPTDDSIEFLAVVQDKGIDLGIRGLFGNALVLQEQFRQIVSDCVISTTYLLCLGKLLDGAVHTFLEDGNLLVLLLADAVDIQLSVVQLDEKVVDLLLLGLIQ